MPCPGADPVEGHDFVYECIYCRTRAGREAFNREHVLSDAFDAFKDALVLRKYVCRNCKGFFGDGIERELTRDAFEAILRYQKGIKKPMEGSIRLSYVEFAVPPGNPWSGVHLQLTGSAGNVVFRPSTQVGALDEATDRWIYLTASELDSGLLEQQAHFKRRVRGYAFLRLRRKNTIWWSQSWPSMGSITSKLVAYKPPTKCWAVAGLRWKWPLR